jgi:hypothetical protein
MNDAMERVSSAGVALDAPVDEVGAHVSCSAGCSPDSGVATLSVDST